MKRPLRERFRSNIQVHWDLEDLRPSELLQYRNLLLRVTRVDADGFDALVLVERGGLPRGPMFRRFDAEQLAHMRRPPEWSLQQQDELYRHDDA